MLTGLFQFWEDWQLYHKVTFDGPNKLIIVNEGVTEIDVEQDLYSDWKEWVAIRDYSKYEYAMRTIGGDPTSGGDFAGATFFVTNGWRIFVDHSVTFDGNLFSDDFDSPFVTPDNTFILAQKFTNLVDKVTPDVTALGSTVAPAIWNYSNASTTADSYGETINNIYANTSSIVTDGGLSSSQQTMLLELYRIMGLDPTAPLIARPTLITAGSTITQNVTGDPETSTVVTRV